MREHMTAHTVLQLMKKRLLLVDGAMGTLLHERGLKSGSCREILNLEKPSMILSVHEDYLRAGADILETNTFSANRIQLARFGLEKHVYTINREGARLARKVAQHRENVLVAGSVGPLGALLRPYGHLTHKEAYHIYLEQIRGLVDGGVDIICIETHFSVVEASIALKAAQTLFQGPIFCLLTVDESGATRIGDEYKSSLLELYRQGAHVVGINCTIGPQDAFRLSEQLLRDYAIPFCVMPNAGIARYIYGKPAFQAEPEYFAEYARSFCEIGVSIIGSCCGTNPEHTAAMKKALRNRSCPRLHFIPSHEIQETHLSKIPQHEEEVLPSKPSTLKDVFNTPLVLTAELVPPQGWKIDETLEHAYLLQQWGVHALHISENPLGFIHMSPVAFASILKNETLLEPILHYSCQNKNIIAIQSELLGIAGLGIHIIIALTGDPFKAFEFPEATTVRDIDSLGLIRLLSTLNSGKNIAGQSIGEGTSFIIGAVINPDPSSWDREKTYIMAKIHAGIHFAVSPPLFDPQRVKEIGTFLHEHNVEFLCGLMPVLNLRHALFLQNEIPGTMIPDEFIQKLERYPDDVVHVQREYLTHFFKETHSYVDGYYFMAPGKKYEWLTKIISIEHLHALANTQKSPAQ